MPMEQEYSSKELMLGSYQILAELVENARKPLPPEIETRRGGFPGKHSKSSISSLSMADLRQALPDGTDTLRMIRDFCESCNYEITEVQDGQVVEVYDIWAIEDVLERLLDAQNDEDAVRLLSSDESLPDSCVARLLWIAVREGCIGSARELPRVDAEIDPAIFGDLPYSDDGPDFSVVHAVLSARPVLPANTLEHFVWFMCAGEGGISPSLQEVCDRCIECGATICNAVVAVAFGSFEQVKDHVKSADCFSESAAGRGLLHIAARRGNLQIVKHLIGLADDFELNDTEDTDAEVEKTPLDCAFTTEIEAALLAAGAKTGQQVQQEIDEGMAALQESARGSMLTKLLFGRRPRTQSVMSVEAQ
jgi:hypothetical protein